MLENQSFSLISFFLRWVVRVMFEISTLEPCPIHMLQVRQIAEELRRRRISMLVRKYEGNAEFFDARQRRHENRDFFVPYLLEPSMTGLNVEHHNGRVR